MNSANPSSSELAGQAAVRLVGRVGRERDDHDRAVWVAASGYGAEPARHEFLAAGALADAPRQVVQLFDRVFHESLLGRSGRLRRPGGQAPVVMSRYSQTRALGAPTSTSMSSLSKGASTRFRSSKSMEMYLASGCRSSAASRAPMSMTPATWAATASALKPASASAATTNPSREMSRAATMPGRLPVGGELGGEDVGLVGHDASKAVSSWLRTAAAKACGGRRVGEGPGEAVAACRPAR